jgi:hypothetical protein
MNLAEITHVSMLLGLKAEELDYAIKEYGHNVSPERLAKWKEIRDVMYRGEKAISETLKRQDLMCAYIWNEQKTVKYNRELMDEMIKMQEL